MTRTRLSGLADTHPRQSRYEAGDSGGGKLTRNILDL